MNNSKIPHKIFVISLGCDKNRVDTEEMLGALHNFRLTADPKEADVIIINTCAFIEKARKEAIDTILQMTVYNKKLIVTGCLPEKYADELIKEIPEIDAVLGVDDYSLINETIKNVIIGKKCNFVGKGLPLNGENRLITTPLHYAYLKIADGCDNHCTFCTIPSIRGKYRSLNEKDLLLRAEKLADEGVKELILVAQDTTSYGKDLHDGSNLLSLIKKLSSIEKIEWIRLLYCYPDGMTDELINEICVNEKVVKYVDIPLQHISDSVLKRMGRKNFSAQIKELIKKLKDNNITIRTTFMVGFPGESEEDFKSLLDFTKEFKIDNAGFFTYSKEDGTPSKLLKPQITQKVKNQRLKLLAATQYEVVKENNLKFLGKIFSVRYEDMDFSKKLFKGRLSVQSPDVDGCVYFKADFPLNVGEIYNVYIESFKGYDFFGRAIKV